MDTEYAKQRLMIHGSPVDNDKEWGKCFLGQLKPYRGTIDDAVYMDIVNCLLALTKELSPRKAIDANVAGAMQGILYIANRWVCDPKSSLRKSGKISDKEIVRLKKWLDNISGLYYELLCCKPKKSYLLKKYTA